MRLGSAGEDDVVRNTNNGSFYRFARLEKSRARIRPLEHFPNGCLIPKPTDTLVDSDLMVALIGPWHDGMVVEGNPTHGRVHYETELTEQIEKLVGLEIAYEALPVGGVGKQSRGSWANKLKNTRMRIEVLEAGLAEHETEVRIEKPMDEVILPRLALRDVVQLPSGLPAQILDFSKVGVVPYARVRTRSQMGVLEGSMPLSVLRPWAMAHLCTT